MNSSIRYGLLIVLISALLIPGVYGVTVNALSGGATGTAGSATTYKTPTNSAILDGLILGSGPKIFQAITGSGSLYQEHSASNKDLASAAVIAQWSNSDSYTYSYSIFPDEGTGFPTSYVQASEALSVSNAVDLFAGAVATNEEGDYAQSWVSADYGSLGGYTNTARADKSNTASSQAVNHAELLANPVSTEPGYTAKATITQDSSAMAPQTKGSSKIGTSSNELAGFWSQAQNRGGDYIYSWMQVRDPEVSGQYHIFNGYSDSVKATKSKLTTSQKIKSASGEWIQFGGTASNAEGDYSWLTNGFFSGLVNGYSATQSATPSGISTSQSIVSAASTGFGYYGAQQDMGVYANNAEGDFANTYMGVRKGLINGEKMSASAKKSGISTSQSFISASGDSVSPFTAISNYEGDFANAATTAVYGHIESYSDSSTASKGSAAVSAGFKSAQGLGAEFQSTAINRAVAEERLEYPVDRGYVNFLVRTDYNTPLVASTTTKATIKNVAITPKSSAKKSALILDPYYTQAQYEGSVDSSASVARNLADKGYSVFTYEDSAATLAQYKTLNKYNIGLAVGHMGTDVIDLSTYPTETALTADQLAASYKNPPKDSFVVLAGCDTFGGYPTPTPLANAISKASLRGGFDNDVYIVWDNAYLAEFYNQMAQGKTAAEANDYVWNTYRFDWAAANGLDPKDPAIAKLVFYGNDGFKL